MKIISISTAFVSVLLAPALCHACACGCGVFSVGTSSMFPTGKGGLLFFDYDYQNQNINWNGSKRSPASQNEDKKLETSFYTLGVQYMFDRSWGIQVEMPVADRFFQFAGGKTGEVVTSSQWTDFGDLRVQGIYSGFSEDQSIGVTFGLKLPTGNYSHNNFYQNIDRDSEIGTGSTDVLVGGFFRHQLVDNLDFFVQANFDLPVITRDGYTPGAEADQAAGLYLNGLSIGRVGIVPVAQVIASERGQDNGPNAADPTASGYTRILLSPGVEFDLHPVMLYADIELPVYQHVTGDQLTGSFLIKLSLGYRF